MKTRFLLLVLLFNLCHVRYVDIEQNIKIAYNANCVLIIDEHTIDPYALQKKSQMNMKIAFQKALRSNKKQKSLFRLSKAHKTTSEKSKVFIINFLIGFLGIKAANDEVFDECVENEIKDDPKIQIDLNDLKNDDDFNILNEYCEEYICFTFDSEIQNVHIEKWIKPFIIRIKELNKVSDFKNYFQNLELNLPKQIENASEKDFDFLDNFCSLSLNFREKETDIKNFNKTNIFQRILTKILNFFKEMFKYMKIGKKCISVSFKSVNTKGKFLNILENTVSAAFLVLARTPIFGHILKIFNLMYVLVSEVNDHFKNWKDTLGVSAGKAKVLVQAPEKARKLGELMRGFAEIFVPLKKKITKRRFSFKRVNF